MVRAKAAHSKRDAAIVAAREGGATLAEIGARFGLSRQRISRILIERGGEKANRSSRAVRRAHQLERAGATPEEVVRLWRSGLGPASVAARLGVSAACVNATILEHATAEDRAQRRRAQSSRAPVTRRRFTDEALIAAVNRAAGWAGRTPSVADYLEYAGSSDEPSIDTIGLRFGGWSGALRAAGLEPPQGAPTPAHGGDGSAPSGASASDTQSGTE